MMPAGQALAAKAGMPQQVTIEKVKDEKCKF
jgi:hypothetical protein